MTLLDIVSSCIFAGPGKVHGYYTIDFAKEVDFCDAAVNAARTRLLNTNIHKLRFKFSKLAPNKRALSIIQGTGVKQVAFTDDLFFTLPASDIKELFATLNAYGVEHIDLSGCNFFRFAQNWQELIESLASISTVNFAHNKLTKASIDQLRQLLSSFRHTALTSLDLSFNQIGDLDEIAFAQIMPALEGTNVTSLNLAGNYLNHQSIVALVGLLRAAIFTRITTLNISLNELGRLSTADLLLLAKNLHDANIRCLDISNNLLYKLGRDAPTVIQALVATRIFEIKLKGNELYKLCHDELIALMAAFKDSPANSVDLSANGWEKLSSAELIRIFSELAQSNIAIINLAGLELHPDFEKIIDAFPANIEIVGMGQNIHIIAHNLAAKVYRAISEGRYYVSDISLPDIYMHNKDTLNQLLDLLINKHDAFISKFAASMLMLGGIDCGSAHPSIDDYLLDFIKGLELFLDSCKAATPDMYSGLYISMAFYYIMFVAKFSAYEDHSDYKSAKLYFERILTTIRQVLFSDLSQALSSMDICGKDLESKAEENRDEVNNSAIINSFLYNGGHPTCLFDFNYAKPFKVSSASLNTAAIEIPSPSLTTIRMAHSL